MTPKPKEASYIQQNLTADLPLTSGIVKYPTGRDIKVKNSGLWMQGKREDDDVYPYWRVHNKLYDLSNFMDSHPGGKFWIEATKGTDITEAFEVSHFGPVPGKILEKYFVRNVYSPRISPFTFEESGFYKTLKRKVTPILKQVGTGPSWQMIFIQDSLLAGFILCGILASWYSSISFAFAAGVFMSLMANASHNFFHQKDNWRMYIFDLTLLSSKEWRISHAISHHLYTNTINDYEITVMEPFFQLLPKATKTFTDRYVVIVTGVLVYILAFLLDFSNRMILVAQNKVKLYIEDILPFVELVILCLIGESWQQGLKIWLIMHVVASSFFTFIGMISSHHHPDIYHEGDESLTDKDWGLHEIVTTRERGEMFMNSVFLASVSFGNHTLHHLFPTVDHSKLPYLQEALLETCKEFNIKFKVYTPWKLLIGLYKQLALITPNKHPPKIVK